MQIVVFPGWYPNRIDSLSGDFIQRHLEAISLNCTVTAIIPVKDLNAGKYEEVVIKKNSLVEHYYYYPSLSSFRWLDAILSFIYYSYLCFKKARTIRKEQNIDLIHVYVLQKNLIIGSLLKWFYNLPYVISEQATTYIDGRFEKMSFLEKKLIKHTYKNCASVHAVSAYLLEVLQGKFSLKQEAVLIPNTVNSSLFFYNPHILRDTVTFVHVSNMVYQKNVEGMLKAFAIVKNTNPHFLLNLVGPLPDSVAVLINKLELKNLVTVWGERKYAEVAEIMQQSDAFVFFTRFETFGCVIIEANACGLPVIVSDLAVVRELIQDGFNGLFVENENVTALAEEIVYTIDSLNKFDPFAISLRTRNRFSYAEVSLQFLQWYKSILTANSTN